MHFLKNEKFVESEKVGATRLFIYDVKIEKQIIG